MKKISNRLYSLIFEKAIRKGFNIYSAIFNWNCNDLNWKSNTYNWKCKFKRAKFKKYLCITLSNGYLSLFDDYLR